MGLEDSVPGSNKERNEEEILEQVLKQRLDIELQKSPDEIDTKKVDAMIALLDRLEDPDRQQETPDAQEFAQQYLYDHIGNFHENDSREKKSYVNYKLIAAILLLVTGISVCNLIFLYIIHI